MNIKTIKTPTTEVFISNNELSVTINAWGNMEGASIMVHDDNLSIRMAGSFRWEELDTICAALTLARTA